MNNFLKTFKVFLRITKKQLTCTKAIITYNVIVLCSILIPIEFWMLNNLTLQRWIIFFGIVVVCILIGWITFNWKKTKEKQK